MKNQLLILLYREINIAQKLIVILKSILECWIFFGSGNNIRQWIYWHPVVEKSDILQQYECVTFSSDKLSLDKPKIFYLDKKWKNVIISKQFGGSFI